MTEEFVTLETAKLNQKWIYLKRNQQRLLS